MQLLLVGKLQILLLHGITQVTLSEVEMRSQREE